MPEENTSTTEQRPTDPRMPAACGSEPKQKGLIHLLDFAILTWHHRRQLLYATAGGMGLGLVAAFVLPARYTATTTILPPQQSSSGSGMLAQFGSIATLGGLGGATGGLNLKNPLDLYVSLLKSSSVEDAMIERFHLKDEYHVRRDSDARRALEDHASIDGTGKDGLLRISLNDRSAARAKELANGYVEEYQRFSEKLAIGEAAQRRLFFETQLASEENKLATAEETLKRSEQSSGAVQPESQIRVTIEAAANLQAQIAAKEVQVEAMRTYAGAGNTDLLQAEQELSSLRGQLTKLTGSRADKEAGMTVSKESIPQTTLEYLRNVRDVKYHETLFQILARQFETAKLDEAKEGAPIQIVDTATLPDKRSSLRPVFIVLAFAAAGGLISLAWILLCDLLRALRTDPSIDGRLRKIGLSP